MGNHQPLAFRLPGLLLAVKLASLVSTHTVAHTAERLDASHRRQATSKGRLKSERILTSLLQDDELCSIAWAQTRKNFSGIYTVYRIECRQEARANHISTLGRFERAQLSTGSARSSKRYLKRLHFRARPDVNQCCRSELD